MNIDWITDPTVPDVLKIAVYFGVGLLFSFPYVVSGRPFRNPPDKDFVGASIIMWAAIWPALALGLLAEGLMNGIGMIGQLFMRD